jgi:hypothetical protein
VGLNLNDQIGSGGVQYYYLTFPNTNLLISSPNWNGGMSAVTWMNSSTGQLSDSSYAGVVSSNNSVLGSATGDAIGTNLRFLNTTGTSGSNWLIWSKSWGGGKGAVTWMNGSTGTLTDGSYGGAVSAMNSLVGTLTTDAVGSYNSCGDGCTQIFSGSQLGNGNYIINSPSFASSTGAITYGNGNIGIAGVVGASNSLLAENSSNTWTYAGSTGVLVGSGTANGGQGGVYLLNQPINNSGNIVPGFVVSPTTPQTIGAGWINATLNAGTNVDIQANLDIVEAAGAVISSTGAGSLTLQAGRNLALTNNITMAGGLALSANDPGAAAPGAGSIVTTGAAIQAGSVAMTNYAGGISTGSITTSGALNLTATGSNSNIVLGATNTGTATLSAGGSITQTSPLSSTGNVITASATGTALTSTGNAMAGFTGTDSSTGAISVTNSSAMLLGTVSTTAGSVAINAPSITGAGNVTAGGYGGTVSITTTSGGLSVGNVSGTSLAFNSAGSLVAGDTTATAGAIGITVPGSISLGGIVGTSVALTSTNGSVTASGPVISGGGAGSLTVTSATGASFANGGNSVGSFNVTVTGAGDVALVNSYAVAPLALSAINTPSGSINVSSAGGINAGGAITAGGGGAVVLDSSAGVITTGAVSGSAVTLASQGPLAVGNISASQITLSSQSGGITQSIGTSLQGGPSVTTSSGGSTTLTNVGDSISKFDATVTGAGNVTLTNTGVLDVTGINVASGNVLIDNTGAFSNSGPITAHAGSVTIKAHSPITVGGNISASGNISLTALTNSLASNMIFNGSVISSAGGITVQAYNNILQNSKFFAALGINITAGGTITFGPGAFSVGNPVTYTANGVTLVPPWIAASLSGGPTSFVDNFLDQFQTALDAQQYAADDPFGKKQADNGGVVVDGGTCTR